MTGDGRVPLGLTQISTPATPPSTSPHRPVRSLSYTLEEIKENLLSLRGVYPYLILVDSNITYRPFLGDVFLLLLITPTTNFFLNG